MCIELEAFLRVSSFFVLILSFVNIIFCNTIGRTLYKNSPEAKTGTPNLVGFENKWSILTRIATIISKISVLIFKERYIIFGVAIFYFIFAILFADSIC